MFICSLRPKGGGLKASADMAAKNVSFFWSAPRFDKQQRVDIVDKIRELGNTSTKRNTNYVHLHFGGCSDSQEVFFFCYLAGGGGQNFHVPYWSYRICRTNLFLYYVLLMAIYSVFVVYTDITYMIEEMNK